MKASTTSTLRLSVPRSSKARWVASAQLSGKSLTEWVTQTLDAAADAADLPPPRWMQKAGFSARLARCLIREGLISAVDVRAAWDVRSESDWVQIPNFGRSCYRELERWIHDDP